MFIVVKENFHTTANYSKTKICESFIRKSAHGLQWKNSEKASTTESSCEGSCPVIIKSSVFTAAVVERSSCMREIAVRFPVATRPIVRYSDSSNARQHALVQMIIKTNIPCHCGCGNLKISTAQWPWDKSKIWSPSRVMVTSPYEWKFLNWEEKLQTEKQTRHMYLFPQYYR